MPASITDIQCSVVEMRQYALRQGQRDVLIDLFERQFVETQEDLGMAVMGQFRDLDDADRFVWLRGFRDMAARRIGLSEFYGGPAWRSHREMANSTMIDSDNVLLLRPAWPGVGIDMKGRTRPVFGASAERTGRVDATIFHLREPASGELLAFCRQTMSPVLTRDAAQVLGLSLIHISEPTRRTPRSYAVLCLKKKKERR